MWGQCSDDKETVGLLSISRGNSDICSELKELIVYDGANRAKEIKNSK